jgi:hypothetical protein
MCPSLKMIWQSCMNLGGYDSRKQYIASDESGSYRSV